MRGPTGSARSIGSRIAALSVITECRSPPQAGGGTPSRTAARGRAPTSLYCSASSPSPSRQLTHSGCSEPAVRIGEGGGASEFDDPEFDDFAASSAGPSAKPEPGPV